VLDLTFTNTHHQIIRIQQRNLIMNTMNLSSAIAPFNSVLPANITVDKISPEAKIDIKSVWKVSPSQSFNDISKNTTITSSKCWNMDLLNKSSQKPSQLQSTPNHFSECRTDSLASSFSTVSSSSTDSNNTLTKFVHDDPRFKSLLKQCADELGVDPSIIEKDYYISHALWCLRKKGLAIQVKGGVSLSKGLGVLHRLSEDVDLSVRASAYGTSYLQDVVTQLNEIDMKSKLKTRDRARLWNKFAGMIKKGLVGFDVVIGAKGSPFYDPRWSYVVLQASYNPLFPVLDSNLLASSVIIEICTSKEEPLDPIQMRLSSFFHTFLEQKKILHQHKRNIPTVLCTHPMITLMQKISDGVVNRFHRPLDGPMPPFASGLRGKVPPFDPRIIRHYEDAALLILNLDKCFPLAQHADYTKLYIQLMERRMVRRRVEAGTIIHDDASLLLIDEHREKVDALRECQRQRLCLYYNINGATLRGHPPTLEECAAIIRGWLLSVGL